MKEKTLPEKQAASDAQDEHLLARRQREELKEELAQHYASLPRRRSAKSRRVTFAILGFVALIVVVFSLLVFWPSSGKTSVGGLPVGSAAPNFSLPIYGGAGIGQTVNLQSLRGHPVVLNFWSESCQPCLSEVPYLQRTYAGNTARAAQGSFILLGIDQADPKDDIAPFGARYHVTYPLLFDANGTVNQLYNVTAIPFTFFIDSSGVIRYVVLQPLTPTTMKQGLAAIGVTILS
jgi:cytochrome c biogenesis protein CcmG/thiol:disulfide interchange protein DsbE